MARIFPFRGWRYNPKKVGDFSKVVTQPYDKISAQMWEQYHEHPLNVVRIILGRKLPQDNEVENVYLRAADTFRQWIEQEIMVQDERPSFYVYYQRYRIDQGQPRVRKGFIGLGQAEDYTSGVVFPHERTLDAPKEDRLRLVRATQSHFSQIFMLYTDPERRADHILDEQTNRPPDILARDEQGVDHMMWSITSRSLIHRLQSILADRPLIIADGHHRYETSLAFRNEQRALYPDIDLSRPFEKVMMAFFNTESEGLTILPTQRVLRTALGVDFTDFLDFLRQHFEVKQYPFAHSREKEKAAAALRREMEQSGQERGTIGLYAGQRNAFYKLTFRADPSSLALMNDLTDCQRKLDVVLLHRIILESGLGMSAGTIAQKEPISYVREFDLGLQMVDQGLGTVCFFLNPSEIDQVRDIALSGEVMPQKSTDFYPKLLSGLVIYKVG